ncbi:unnamed protein product [Amoebophrya sp. A120]|nr:unnamed protein product [Amoebophrya sp. A120]|eukprot:GSA120T00000315001.1
MVINGGGMSSILQSIAPPWSTTLRSIELSGAGANKERRRLHRPRTRRVPSLMPIGGPRAPSLSVPCALARAAYFLHLAGPRPPGAGLASGPLRSAARGPFEWAPGNGRAMSGPTPGRAARARPRQLR